MKILELKVTRLIVISLCLILALISAGCGNTGPDLTTIQSSGRKTEDSGNTSTAPLTSAAATSASSEAAHTTTVPPDPPTVLVGPGNLAANLLNGGIATESDGYIYHLDEIIEGNLWRTSLEKGTSELICEGNFRALNVNAGQIFCLGRSSAAGSPLETGGICVMNVDGSNAKVLREGYTSQLFLQDEYLYYTEGKEGTLHRMKSDGSGDELLLKAEVYDNFVLVDEAVYLFIDLSGENPTNLYRMPLDGSNAPELIEEDLFGAYGVGKNHILYGLRGNSTQAMYSYNTQTGTKTQIIDREMEDMVPYGDYFYYFWHGRRADDADSGIYRMKHDFSEDQLLIQTTDISSLNIAGDKLFWETNNDLRQPTVAKLDGTDVQYVILSP